MKLRGKALLNPLQCRRLGGSEIVTDGSVATYGQSGRCSARTLKSALQRFMLEAVVIIVALGGLELVLWSIDHRQQKKQIELLDSIWAELAIRNSAEEEAKTAGHV